MDDNEIIRCDIPTDTRFLNLVQNPPKIFGRLMVIKYAGKKLLAGRYRNMWECQCSCGKITIVKVDHLTTGRVESCGCLQQELFNNITHNMSNSEEYSSYQMMMDRCYNPNNISYKNYGGRGIKVCDRWFKQPENFLNDMGPKPTPQHSIERKDNNGDYSPENCEWATRDQQNNNQRSNIKITAHGKTQTAAQWAKELSISAHIIRRRYNNGWNHEDIVNTPIKCKL